MICHSILFGARFDHNLAIVSYLRNCFHPANGRPPCHSSNSIQFNSVQFSSTQCNSVQSYSIRQQAGLLMMPTSSVAS